MKIIAPVHYSQSIVGVGNVGWEEKESPSKFGNDLAIQFIWRILTTYHRYSQRNTTSKIFYVKFRASYLPWWKNVGSYDSKFWFSSMTTYGKSNRNFLFKIVTFGKGIFGLYWLRIRGFPKRGWFLFSYLGKGADFLMLRSFGENSVYHCRDFGKIETKCRKVFWNI